MNPTATPILTALGDDVPAAAGRLRSLGEADLAELRLAEGARVVERGGRFWVQTFPGFYQPIHQLAEHRAAHVRRPVRACWGYRSALVTEDHSLANGAYPVHLLEDFRAWSPASLGVNRRYDLRRCHAKVELVVAHDPEPFLADGWEVYASTQERVHLGTEARSAYLRDIAARVPDPRRLFVAGFIDGRLSGYMESYLVDGVFYGRDLYVRTEVSKTGIGTGLYLASMEIALATGRADRLCFGPEISDRPGLARFKRTLGVGIVHVPTRVVIPGPIRLAMRRLRPAAYYRITGGDARRGWHADPGMEHSA